MQVVSIQFDTIYPILSDFIEKPLKPGRFAPFQPRSMISKSSGTYTPPPKARFASRV